MANKEHRKAGAFGQNPQSPQRDESRSPDRSTSQNVLQAAERDSNDTKTSGTATQNPPVRLKCDHRAKGRIAPEALSICATPAILVVCTLTNADQTALLSLVVVLASLGVFFATYESSAPRLRDIMPTVVLAALAAAGRILFAPIPDFKPVSAIAIIAGVAFGRKSGFMVGALAALASNFFFGQGPWTPWQMYAWGLVGYGAGLLAAIPVKAPKITGNSRLAECGEGRSSRKQPLIERHVVIIYIYGFVSCLMYGFILNAWSILSFYHAQASGLAGVLLVYATALPFDVAHGIATVVFLATLYAPWRRKLKRIKSKYGME
ncbi:ECF transporter S component [uncultured Senegalimassilia sp.]|uniref:ECF transporter S component n=1 Tax=uncultured Senegalimassilia sp. TaxID=1714350 RepID=UPI00261D8337|nr:ECF transporter S component [uncultured Senegalimassilia sp.]